MKAALQANGWTSQTKVVVLAEDAHLLLQVCCAVLDGRLDALFRELYPRFRLTSPALELPGL
jgi:hypothetical protein